MVIVPPNHGRIAIRPYVLYIAEPRPPTYGRSLFEGGFLVWGMR